MMGAKPLLQDSPTKKLHGLPHSVEVAIKLSGLSKREATHGDRPDPYAPLAMLKLMQPRQL